MPDAARPAATFDYRFARSLWRLIRVYWASPDGKRGGLLLFLAITFEIGTVGGSLLVANAERRILDGLEHRQVGHFLAAVIMFFGATLAFVFASAYRIFVRQAVELRWRRGLTTHFVERWVGVHCFLLEELHGEVDNPQQRIQEDVRDFVASALGLSLSFLAAVATLVSFGGLLYGLSASWPLPINGTVVIPGLMLWVALAYAAVSMWLTHLVGRRLVPINYDQLRLEADFRYGLVHFRDNAAAVTISRGEKVERRDALTRFRHLIANWWQLVRAQRNLSLLTGGISQANALVPVLIAAPAYFARLITLGMIVQIRIAYGQISAALSWFVFAYQEIARWRANVERLSTFSESLDALDRRLEGPGIEVVPVAGDTLRIHGLRLEEPDGRRLLQDASGNIMQGDRVAISGRSGTGKTIFMRALAGIWPFGEGRIDVPRGARMLFVPQWPYIPIGSLRAAASYPDAAGAFPDDDIIQALRLLGLGRLETRLDTTDAWEQLLSPHEQQQLALVRVLLQAPDWIFLDKATSALDEDTERRAYQLLVERFPGASIVTIVHRPSVAEYHTRRWTLVPVDGVVNLEAA